jgi:streptomycin 3"-adenylyltransferase
VVTGKIVPKDVAADWSIEHLPSEYQSILFDARQAYLGNGNDHLFLNTDQTAESILFMKSKIVDLLNLDKNDV